MKSVFHNNRTSINSARMSCKFSIGICASDDTANLSNLLHLIENNPASQDFVLSRIILVASECTGKGIEYAQKLAQEDTRLLIIQEEKRKGKADAINKIFGLADGEFLMLVNADALPSNNSIRRLLELISANDSVGIVSASPFFESKRGMLSKIEQLMWTMHNESSLLLNHMNISNHSNDEMMVIRSNLWRRLPEGLVNDGAFIAAVAKRTGYSIKFCKDAKVKIDVPSRVSDDIGQRRRIIFGHLQIWKMIGESPITVESMLFSNPLVSLKIMIHTLACSPFFILVLPIAILTETLAFFGALADFSRSSKRHKVWRRYGG